MDKVTRPMLVALGGHALKAGSNLLDYPSLPAACETMARYQDEGLVITHGNGPQIGRMAQTESGSRNLPLDILGAETEGLLGYVIEQELSNQMRDNARLATLLTRTEVDSSDSDFNKPVKPVGDGMSAEQAEKMARELGWTFTEKDGKYRRLVASPRPLKTLQLESIKTLVSNGFTVICAGGGGIPVLRDLDNILHGLDAVIDKDYTSALLGMELEARKLILATDIDGVYRNRDAHNNGQKIKHIHVDELATLTFPEGSMGPKVNAACEFVRATGSPAVIGSLTDLHDLIEETAGTVITP